MAGFFVVQRIMPVSAGSFALRIQGYVGWERTPPFSFRLPRLEASQVFEAATRPYWPDLKVCSPEYAGRNIKGTSLV